MVSIYQWKNKKFKANNWKQITNKQQILSLRSKTKAVSG